MLGMRGGGVQVQSLEVCSQNRGKSICGKGGRVGGVKPLGSLDTRNKGIGNCYVHAYSGPKAQPFHF